MKEAKLGSCDGYTEAEFGRNINLKTKNIAC